MISNISFSVLSWSIIFIFTLPISIGSANLFITNEYPSHLCLILVHLAMAFYSHSEYTHPLPDSNIPDLNAKGTCLLPDGNGRRIEANHTPVFPKPVSLQNSGTKFQNEINDPGRYINGQSRFIDILSYRIILIDTESTHNVRKADLTGLFVLEWQQWPLKGQPR